MFSSKQAFYPLTNFGNNALFPIGGGTLDTAGNINIIDWGTITGYTLEYWITGNGVSDAGPGNHNSGGTPTLYWSFGPVGSKVEFSYYLNNRITTRSGVYNSAIWNNICLVQSSGSVSIYINGEIQEIEKNSDGNFTTSKSATFFGDVNTPFMIGGYFNTYWQDVYIDNLRVSNIRRYTGLSYNLATEAFISDSNTQLLLICDGPNNSTSITDSSSFARTVNNSGNLVFITTARQNHS